MSVRNIVDLPQFLPREGKLMALDFGQKTIGLAVSDVTRMVATPLETIRRAKFTADAERLTTIIAEQSVIALVLGLPINMDGTEGPRVQSTRQFAANLLEKIDIELTFWDERLSTQAVTRTMIEADLSRSRRAELVDKMAATYILQGALDFLRAHQND